MKIPLKKAFDVEAFKKITTEIDSDITLSEAYTLSHELKGIEREYEYSWSTSFLLICLFVAIIYALNLATTLAKPTLAPLIMILLIFILGTWFQLRRINNYLVYKKHYHQEYTDASEKLQKRINELHAKDDGERYALDLFLQKRGSHLLGIIETSIQQEVDIEDHIKERLLQELRDVFLADNDTGNVKNPSSFL